jgi:hypothetical protein
LAIWETRICVTVTRATIWSGTLRMGLDDGAEAATEEELVAV